MNQLVRQMRLWSLLDHVRHVPRSVAEKPTELLALHDRDMLEVPALVQAQTASGSNGSEYALLDTQMHDPADVLNTRPNPPLLSDIYRQSSINALGPVVVDTEASLSPREADFYALTTLSGFAN